MSYIKKINIPEDGSTVAYDLQASHLSTGTQVEESPASTSNDTTVATTKWVKDKMQDYVPTYEETSTGGTLIFGSAQVTDTTITI